MKEINYQRVYEEEASLHLTALDYIDLGLSERYFELSDTQRRLVNALIDMGYELAVTDAMDPGVLEETALLSVDMADQLKGFSDMLKTYLHSTK